MRIFIVISLLLGGFIFYQQHETVSRQNAFVSLLDKIEQQPLNQFEIKRSLYTQSSARCESINNEEEGVSSDECLNLVNSYKNECARKVFRLAPIEFTNQQELDVYATRYQKCVFSKQYTYLIEQEFLL